MKSISGVSLPKTRVALRVSRPASLAVSASSQPQTTDRLIRGISDNGQVLVMVADATALVRDAATRHKTAPTATAALGRALVGALLMGSYRKEGETLQVTFNGRGELGFLTAIADWKGNVKGMCQNPLADPPLKASGKLDVASAVGKGVLSVIRSIPYQKEPYTGVVPINSGEIAEDLAYYLAESEQTQSALGLGVSLEKDAGVKAAGGFLIQVLPFAEEETLSTLETNLATAPSVTEMLSSGMTPEDIARKLMGELQVSEGITSISPVYGPCEPVSLKQRMKKAVATLGRTEVDKILKEEGRIEVNCEFCQQAVVFTDGDVADVMAQCAEREVRS